MKRTRRTEDAEGRARTGGGIPNIPITALFIAAIFLCMPAQAPAMQILDAADHAELEAVISDKAVSRIALTSDRIARVIRGPDGFTLEHDAARGDVYLRPVRLPPGLPPGVPREPVTLFIGTRKGFTYRLALRVAARGSAQILIRNAAAVTGTKLPRPGDPHVGALVALIRAVALRELPPGYAVETLSRTVEGDVFVRIETWRGPRFIAHVLETNAGAGVDAATLADRLAPGVAALWLAEPGSGPAGGRLAVAVHDAMKSAPAGVAP